MSAGKVEESLAVLSERLEEARKVIEAEYPDQKPIERAILAVMLVMASVRAELMQ